MIFLCHLSEYFLKSSSLFQWSPRLIKKNLFRISENSFLTQGQIFEPGVPAMSGSDKAFLKTQCRPYSSFKEFTAATASISTN